MASDDLLSDSASRRAFLRTAGAGLAGGSGVLLAACGGSSKPARPTVASAYQAQVRDADISVLNGVLDLEHTAIAAYTAGIPLLTGHARVAATWFLGQELQHAAKLEATITGAGGKANPAQASYDLGNPSNADQVLELLHRTETSLLSAYLDALPRLIPGWLRAVAAGILANESQHLSVLQAAQGRNPVPGAFVTAHA
jgi:hypothetical protein